MNNGKVRIYELSKELNLDNKDILNICEQLNISVKSHSSTITNAQAERIRSYAEHNVPSKVAATSSKSSSGNSSISRKPEILEIRSKKGKTPTSDHQYSSGETVTAANAAPTLMKPSLPTLKKPPQTTNFAESPQSSESLPQKEIEPLEPDEVELKEPQNQVAITDQQEDKERPQLLRPPTRPASPTPKTTLTQKPILKTEAPSQPESTPKPQVLVENVDNTAKVVQPVQEKAQPNVTIAREKPKTNEAAPEAPKLRRPKKIQTTESTASQTDATDTNISTTDEVESDGDILTVLDKPKPKLKLKRPAYPSKKGEWEEDEEESEAKGKGKSAKLASKNKRPKQALIIDEDEDLDELSANSSSTSVAVSMSIARPPKPASASGQGKAAPASQRKQHKPTIAKSDSRTNRLDSKQRQQDKDVSHSPEKVVIATSLTVRELSTLLQTPETEIIKRLFFKGIPVNITQTLDIPTASLVAEELGIEVEAATETSAAAKTEMLDEKDLESLQRRPPVVTIMGHVDHGKTTLLDSIRKTKVAAGEAGGITQHIGAYHVDIEHEDRIEQIVFLDTPGHEAFTAMRARGTKVTDIAVLVVAADDGVQPQTREAISHAKAAQVPIVIAINKIDKPESEPDRIKQELTQHGLVPEDWGGDTIMVPVSAIKGENLDTLLEMLLLVAEIEELSANPDRLAKGTVVEAHLDKARGPVATLLVQNGTLRVGDCLVAGSVFGKIRAMVDDRGDRVEAASPSFAVEVLGLSDVPAAGDEFEVFASEKEARAVAADRTDDQRKSRLEQTMASRRITLSSLSAQAQEGELKELNLILKADVQGSVEAILGSLGQLPQEEVQIRVLLAAPGEVTETDVDLAAASGAVVIGFNTTLASGSRAAADREGVDIRNYSIIYNLLDDIQGAMEGLLEPEEVEEHLGEAQVRAVFPVGRGAVAGCYVQSGKMLRNCRIRVRRKDQVIYEGNLDSLKRMRDDVKEVNSGFECGIGVDKFNNWMEKDIIEAYQMIFKRRTLSSK